MIWSTSVVLSYDVGRPNVVWANACMRVYVRIIYNDNSNDEDLISNLALENTINSISDDLRDD